jgi:hypothetical protein
MATIYSILLKPIFAGWAVCLSDGRELARFRGPCARLRAREYVQSAVVDGLHARDAI